MSKGRFDISDKQWDRIKDMPPPEKTDKAGRPCEVTNRNVWNGATWIARTGAQWEDLPRRYGAKSTIHTRFKNWKDSGILIAIFEELSKDCDMQDLPLDSTSCKVHQSAAGAKRGLMNPS